MRKFILILFVIIVTLNNSGAQTYEYVPFPNGNAIWSEFYLRTQNKAESIYDTAFDKIAIINEDTLLDGHLYKKLYTFNDTIFNIDSAVYLGGIRENNKIVYYNGSHLHYLKPYGTAYEETILYDFNLEKGDTIDSYSYGITTNFAYYGAHWFVRDVDTIFLGNKMRRELTICIGYDTIQWVEGIGNIEGMMFASAYPTMGSSPIGDIICFKQNDTLVYFNNNYPECMPLNVPETVTEEKSTIQIFPNPATDLVYINFEEKAIVEIINMQGQVELMKMLSEKNSSVDVSGLSCGVYTLRIKTESGVATQKLIKQ